jgi:sugar phosphate isomerase/epimerase
MIPQITVQLYSVRDLAKTDYAGTIRALAETGFHNVEPAGYPGVTTKEAAKLFQSLGLGAPSAHVGLPVGDDKNAIIDEALLMGHKYLITGCPPGFRENYTSLDRVKAMAELYCQAAENLKPHGLQVGYHNHDWDLVVIDGRRSYQVFLENTPETVLYEADVFWVARAGLDPAAFVREIGPRGKVLHFKDGIVSGEAEFKEATTESGRIMVSESVPFRPAGQGQVDLVAASRAARHAEYLAVELDSYAGDMMQAIKDSYRYLTANGIARGTR